jgi:hypothetical protein
MLLYDDWKDKPRDFLAATSLTLDEFTALLPAFQAAYESRYPSHLTAVGTARQRCEGGGVQGVLARPADQLLFILGYQKTNPLQTMQALQCGLSQPQAH